MEEVASQEHSIGSKVGGSEKDFFKGSERILPPDFILLPDSL